MSKRYGDERSYDIRKGVESGMLYDGEGVITLFIKTLKVNTIKPTLQLIK